jgi:hypothetical protein
MKNQFLLIKLFSSCFIEFNVIYYFGFVFSQQIQNLKNFKKNYQNFWTVQKSCYGLLLDFLWYLSIKPEPHNLWLPTNQSTLYWVHEEKKKIPLISSERSTAKFFLKCVILTTLQSLNWLILKTFWFVLSSPLFISLFIRSFHQHKNKNTNKLIEYLNQIIIHWTCFCLLVLT